MKMNEKQISIVKRQMTVGKSLALIFLLLGILFNVYYVIVYTMENKYVWLFFIDIVILLFSIGILYGINKKLYRDIKEKEMVTKEEVVCKKEEKKDYEAGSGAMYIPVLGDLFPKLWGQKMNEVLKYKIELQKGFVMIDEDVYDLLHTGDRIRLFYAKNSKLFLGIEKL